MEHTLWSPFLKRGKTTPICHFKGTECPHYVAKACLPRQPYNIQSLQEIGMDLIQPRGSAAAELFDSPGDLGPSEERAQPKVLWLCFLLRMRVGGTEEIFKLFLPRLNYTLS